MTKRGPVLVRLTEADVARLWAEWQAERLKPGRAAIPRRGLVVDLSALSDDAVAKLGQLAKAAR